MIKSDLKNEVSCLNYEKSTVQQEKNCLNESYEELNKGNNFFLDLCLFSNIYVFTIWFCFQDLNAKLEQLKSENMILPQTNNGD